MKNYRVTIVLIIIFGLLIGFLLSSCGPSAEEKAEMEYLKTKQEPTYTIKGAFGANTEISVVKIDSCEYVVAVYRGFGVAITKK